MSDTRSKSSAGIVERLRAHPAPSGTVTEQFREMVQQRADAADEIARLRSLPRLRKLIEREAEVERLRATYRVAVEDQVAKSAEIARLRALLEEIAERSEVDVVAIRRVLEAGK